MTTMPQGSDNVSSTPDLMRKFADVLIANADSYFKLDHEKRQEVARSVSDAALDVMPALLLLRDAEPAAEPERRWQRVTVSAVGLASIDGKPVTCTCGLPECGESAMWLLWPRDDDGLEWLESSCSRHLERLVHSIVTDEPAL